MARFPLQLRLQKGDVICLLYAVGGLLMTVAAGGQCVDVAVRTAQNPANLRRLSNALVRLLRCQIRAANSMRKQKLKRLYISESFLDMAGTLWRLHDSQGLHLFPGSPEQQTNPSANCLSAKRRRFYYVLLCGLSDRPILTLCLADKGGELKSHSPKNRLQWLADFGTEARTRGDCVLLLVAPHSGRISTGSAESLSQITSDTDDRNGVLMLGLCALIVVLFVMFQPYVVAFIVICLGWKAHR